MTAKDIEKLFIEELGIEDVAVWSYDEKKKILNMTFIVDFSEIDTPLTHETIVMI